MKRQQVNGLLALSVIGLGVTLYVTREQTPPAEPLTALTASTIERIEVAHEGQPAIRLQRDGADWQLTAPVTAPADSLEVNGILNLATTLGQAVGPTITSVVKTTTGTYTPAFAISIVMAVCAAVFVLRIQKVK